jgi:pimeloyl-ACP methyl ester carboxylesterase
MGLKSKILDLYQSEKGYLTIKRWYDNLVSNFDFPFESKFIETRFGKTHYLTAGEPETEPLILVQAIAGSAPLWYHQIPALAQNFQVFALDTPGQPGRSDPYPPPFLENGYSNWLLDVLDNLDIQLANMAGVSSGGWYVMRFALQHPERVKKIVMLSPTGLANARFPINIFLKNVLSKKKDENTLEKELSTRSFLPSSASEEFDRNLARAMALATRHFKLGKTLSLYNPGTDRLNLINTFRVLKKLFFAEPMQVLNQLETPGLVILGEHEMLFNSQRVARKINQKLPALDTVIIKDTGHSAMYDRPQEVNQRIIDFLIS